MSVEKLLTSVDIVKYNDYSSAASGLNAMEETNMNKQDETTKSDTVAGLLDELVIPHGGYKCIVADPPWQYGKWGMPSDRPNQIAARDMPYPTMSVNEICEMHIKALVADDCDLYLWATQKYLPAAFEVMKAWGFKYCQILTWCKTPRGTGQGGLYCPTTEFLILGRRGKMPKDKTRLDSTWWNIKRPHNQHSKKPEFFQDLIERMSDGPRIELFARRPREGWDVWGNEV